MTSMSVGPEPREHYTLLVWAERQTGIDPHPHWYRIILIRDTWRDGVGVYYQRTKEPVAFPFLTPKEGWQTVTYTDIRGSSLATQLELWGIKPSRTKIERASDV